MTVRCRAPRLMALLLFLSILFLLTALPLHRAGHLCTGVGCPVCLSISRCQTDNTAPLPTLQDGAGALEGYTSLPLPPQSQCILVRTLTALKTEMNK
ncbi:hypothetical protein [Cloacibacillus sp.]|uniref:hypothetical protein n=1 Tax=Cloacibacillus sp. TaxID=2049023 RepID=UPI0025C66BE8|nr:hypothetical protein [Cloacibacillus sp.]MCC8059075.1 hypothetical protein [Cloacibacillus sp.]